VDSDLIKGLKTWIQKQVFEDFSTVVGQTDIEINQIICAADTLATLMELGIESEVCLKPMINMISKKTKLNILILTHKTIQITMYIYILFLNLILTD
jgi:hypothetical protein